jgi:O-antigen/teichoic acid export membrane protein
MAIKRKGLKKFRYFDPHLGALFKDYQVEIATMLSVVPIVLSGSLTILIGRNLPPSEYSLYLVGTNVVNFLGIFLSGSFLEALNSKIPNNFSNEINENEFSFTLRNMYRGSLFSLLCLVFLLLIGTPLSHILYIFLVLLVNVPTSSALISFQNSLVLKQKFLKQNYFLATLIGSNLLLQSVLGMMYRFNIYSIVLLQSAIAFLMMWLFSSGKRPEFINRHINPKRERSYKFLIPMLWWIIMNGDIVIVPLINRSKLSHYAAISMIVRIPLLLLSVISGAISVEMTKSIPKAVEKMIYAVKAYSIIVISYGIIIVWFGESFLRILLGIHYSKDSSLSMLLLLLLLPLGLAQIMYSACIVTPSRKFVLSLTTAVCFRLASAVFLRSQGLIVISSGIIYLFISISCLQMLKGVKTK